MYGVTTTKIMLANIVKILFVQKYQKQIAREFWKRIPVHVVVYTV